MSTKKTDKSRPLERKVIEIKLAALKLSQEHFGVRHFGGAFSAAHILTALYKDVMNLDVDRFILSKGHSCSTWYPLLREAGYNPTIQGHPSRDPANGILATAGSLGHGLPIALGIAFAKKLKKEPGKVFVLMGDGECQEGSVYEAVSIAANLKLDNLVAIIDHNKIQGSGFVSPATVERLLNAVKGEWNAQTIDGHRFEEIIPALQTHTPGKPQLIVANTIKGRGVSFMEGNPVWHSKPINKEEYQHAVDELTAQLEIQKK